VIARDRTCRFPHCTRTARRCHLDHRIAWEAGGPTSEANLHALCARHHHLKHETDWKIRASDTGDTEWRSPTGHRYRQPAATYPIDRTTEADPDPPPF
jgi:hypothetical protein